MTLPSFSTKDDPGPNFAALIKEYEIAPLTVQHPLENLAHGTTCVAIKFKDGVVLAGDRRATSGHHISHRTLDKVFQSDTYSGVAISGAAGPAIEMVKLFQLQLEHYEKVEGKSLSLEGKANQLSSMIRQNLPVPAITGIRPFDSLIQSSINFWCSSWDKVGDSPVVPTGTKPFVPFSR